MAANDKTGDRAKLDQGIALQCEFYPIQWRTLYLRLIEEGFCEVDAMKLLITFISASCGPSN